jgi:cullin 1
MMSKQVITDPNEECLDVYEAHFATAFITATEQFYKTESENFLAQNPVPDYLKKAEERLREEENRVDRYVHSKTRKFLISKCENGEHSDLLTDFV